MNAIILAAGFGSRLMPFTQNCPKCMVEYKGIKIIDYEISALKNNNINNIAVVGGYLFDILNNYLKEKYNINFLYQNKIYDKTNMVHTLFCAEDFLNQCISTKQDLIVSYSDIVYFDDTVKKLIDDESDFSIIVDKSWLQLWKQRFDDPLVDAETMVIQDGFIKELGKKTTTYDNINGQYIGLFKFSYRILSDIIDFYYSLDRNIIYDGKDFNNMYMTTFLQLLINEGYLSKAITIDGSWCECDFVKDLHVDIVRDCK